MHRSRFTPESVSTQRLLFGRFDPLQMGREAASSHHERFLERGFTVLKGVPDVVGAQKVLRSFIEGIDTQKAVLLKDCEVELAKVDGIPICHDAIEVGCQALHYDYALPFVEGDAQSVYLVVGLYKPASAPPSSAKTRVAFIPDIAKQVAPMDKEVVRSRLDAYVRDFGDGWVKPEPTNTKRIALFARVLDAIFGRNELVKYRYSSMAQWFHDDTSCSSIDAEEMFFKRCGVDLASVEKEVCLQPGELLVIDNLRCVHGRKGKREPEEIVQFLYGVRQAPPGSVSRMVDWLVGLFSK